MSCEEALSRLIGDIYDAALDPTLWPAVLSKSADFVDAQGAGLLSKDSVTRLGNAHYHVGVDAHYLRLYEEIYWQFDPLSPLFFFGVGEVTSRMDYLADAEFLESRFHQEWTKPQGLIDSANVVLEKSATSLSLVSFLRSERKGMVDDEMRRRVGLVSPHIRRSILIGKAIDLKAARANEFASALDGISAAMFLIDAQGRVIHANAAGVSMLAAGDVLSAAGGRLIASGAEAESMLREAFMSVVNGDAALGGKAIALPLSAAQGGEHYVGHLLPLTAGARRRTGSRYAAIAALFVHRAALEAPSPPELIAKAFSLTPAELRVLLAVVEMDSVSAIASFLGISENTVHTHLRRLFAKTGTRRQAELLKLVAGFLNPLLR